MEQAQGPRTFHGLSPLVDRNKGTLWDLSWLPLLKDACLLLRKNNRSNASELGLSAWPTLFTMGKKFMLAILLEMSVWLL
jgi:hypothetical protein